MLVLLLVVTVLDSVVLRGGLRVADSVFRATNDTPYPGLVAPTSPLRSGSPASLVRWDTIGREGQAFVAGGRPPSELAAASGRTPVAPIRAYVGLLAAPGPSERAALAVAELERTGAFDRSVLAVVTTTGTGWIDTPTADSLEMIWGGDTAIVATQYSYLPSWLSFVVDRTRAEAEGRALFDAVHARVEQMPPDRRPRLFAFGESLGSQGSEAAFSGVDDARAQADGVLWVGPPNSNRLHAALTARRDPGTPAVLPVVGGGREVRFGATPEDLARPPGPWDAPRIVYLQHASDPVVWWSPSLLWHRPAWLAEPAGRDVSPAMDWYPVVTFWQVTIDLTNSLGVPDGHGHQYRGVMLDGWLAPWVPRRVDPCGHGKGGRHAGDVTAPQHTATDARPEGAEDTDEEDTPSHWRRLAPPAVVAVLLLAWSNLVLPALPADAVLKALFNLGGVAAMVTVARLLGLTWADLGHRTRHLGRRSALGRRRDRRRGARLRRRPRRRPRAPGEPPAGRRLPGRPAAARARPHPARHRAGRGARVPRRAAGALGALAVGPGGPQRHRGRVRPLAPHRRDGPLRRPAAADAAVDLGAHRARRDRRRRARARAGCATGRDRCSPRSGCTSARTRSVSSPRVSRSRTDRTAQARLSR